MTSNPFHHGADVQGRERAKVSNSWPGLKGGHIIFLFRRLKDFERLQLLREENSLNKSLQPNSICLFLY
jgi:hypothetical protein